MNCVVWALNHYNSILVDGALFYIRKYLHCSLALFCFGVGSDLDISGSSQSSFLLMCSGITLVRSQRTIYGARNQTRISYIQFKMHYSCIIPLAPDGLLFIYILYCFFLCLKLQELKYLIKIFYQHSQVNLKCKHLRGEVPYIST